MIAFDEPTADPVVLILRMAAQRGRSLRLQREREQNKTRSADTLTGKTADRAVATTSDQRPEADRNGKDSRK